MAPVQSNKIKWRTNPLHHSSRYCLAFETILPRTPLDSINIDVRGPASPTVALVSVGKRKINFELPIYNIIYLFNLNDFRARPLRRISRREAGCHAAQEKISHYQGIIRTAVDALHRLQGFLHRL